MILKQITNLQKHSSMLDLRKVSSTQISATNQVSTLSQHLTSIFKTSHQEIQKINYPYFSQRDSGFVARCNQVEWMFSQQMLLRLGDDTIFEAILIMDKYISIKGSNTYLMPKLAAVCLILSSKTNEIYPIKLHKLNLISKFCYTNAEYIELQMEILSLFDFNIPHGSVYQIFKLYQMMFNLETVLKRDASIFVLKKCVLDFNLLYYGVRATSLAAISYLCRLKRVLINTGAVTQTCRQYPKALSRINQLIKQAKKSKQTLNPETHEYINI